MNNRSEAPTVLRNAFAVGTFMLLLLTGYAGIQRSIDDNNLSNDQRQMTAAQIANDPALQQFWQGIDTSDQAAALHDRNFEDAFAFAAAVSTLGALASQVVVDRRLK